MEQIINYIKENWILSAVVGLFAALLIFPKTMRKMFGGKTRRRRRRTARRTTARRTTARRTTARRTTARVTGKGYAAAGGGYIPLKFNKNGTPKKAWQVAGTVAAKQRMSRLRKKR